MKTPVRNFSYVVYFVIAIGIVFSLRYHKGRGFLTSVSASIGDPTATAHVINAISAQSGVVPHFMPMVNSTSSGATAQAVANWSSYVQGRTRWSMPANSASRLAAADFAARQSGPPTITADQAATAASNAINAKLAAMTTSQLQALYQQMMTVSGPNGSYSAIGFNPNYFSISLSGSGTYVVTVNSSAFSAQKILYANLAPQMMSNSANFYPSEVQIIFYSLISGDMGMDDTRFAAYAQQLGSITGLDMSTMTPFGADGYLARRPLDTFIDQTFLDSFYSQLGF